MIAFYPQIKLVHIYAVIASGTLFFLRGLVLHLGGRWAVAAPLRYTSYAIDTVLLTAALMLMMRLQQYPFVHTWLTVKACLLVLYIGLGVFALHRGRTRAIRISCWLAALIVYIFIVGVARTKSPWGLVSTWI